MAQKVARIEGLRAGVAASALAQADVEDGRMGDIGHRIPYVGRASAGHLKYRRTVPPDVRPMLATRDRPQGQKEWVKTFKRRTPIEAVEREAARLAAVHDSIIARARGGEVLSAETVAEAEARAREIRRLSPAARHELLAFLTSDAPSPFVAATVSAVEHGGRYVAERITVTAAHERDRERYGGDRHEKVLAYAVSSFVAVAGDPDIRAVTRQDVIDWLAHEERKGLAPATIRRRLEAIRAMVNRVLLDLDHDGRNPFEKQRVKGGRGGAGDRLPFSREMLAKIDEYLATSRRVRHETRSALRMMKCTGCGPAEIAGLVLSDVDLDGEIPSIWIRPNALRGLKTEARDRRVPLVGDALQGARDACRLARLRSPRTNPDRLALFTSFRTDGRGADTVSAKLNKAIRAAGIPKSPRLVSYSYRHTMKEALRSAGVADHVQRRLLGHAGHGVADRYGSPHGRLAEARDALVRAMDHLGDVDERIYRADERVQPPGTQLKRSRSG
jgi:integrase